MVVQAGNREKGTVPMVGGDQIGGDIGLIKKNEKEVD